MIGNTCKHYWIVLNTCKVVTFNIPRKKYEMEIEQDVARANKNTSLFSGSIAMQSSTQMRTRQTNKGHANVHYQIAWHCNENAT